MYESGTEREETLREKERIIRAAQQRFDDEYETRFSNDNYRGFSTLPINNAYLELYRLYHGSDTYMTDLYERSGKTLPEFIAAAKSMPKKGTPGRVALAQALGLSQN